MGVGDLGFRVSGVLSCPITLSTTSVRQSSCCMGRGSLNFIAVALVFCLRFMDLRFGVCALGLGVEG